MDACTKWLPTLIYFYTLPNTNYLKELFCKIKPSYKVETFIEGSFCLKTHKTPSSLDLTCLGF